MFDIVILGYREPWIDFWPALLEVHETSTEYPEAGQSASEHPEGGLTHRTKRAVGRYRDELAVVWAPSLGLCDAENRRTVERPNGVLSPPTDGTGNGATVWDTPQGVHPQVPVEPARVDEHRERVPCSTFG